MPWRSGLAPTRRTPARINQPPANLRRQRSVGTARRWRRPSRVRNSARRCTSRIRSIIIFSRKNRLLIVLSSRPNTRQSPLWRPYGAFSSPLPGPFQPGASSGRVEASSREPRRFPGWPMAVQCSRSHRGHEHGHLRNPPPTPRLLTGAQYRTTFQQLHEPEGGFRSERGPGLLSEDASPIRDESSTILSPCPVEAVNTGRQPAGRRWPRGKAIRVREPPEGIPEGPEQRAKPVHHNSSPSLLPAATLPCKA